MIASGRFIVSYSKMHSYPPPYFATSWGFFDRILIFFTTPSHVNFFTAGTFRLIYAVVSYVVFSATNTANLVLSTSVFGVTVSIAFVTNHGAVLIFYTAVSTSSSGI